MKRQGKDGGIKVETLAGNLFLSFDYFTHKIVSWMFSF